MNSHGQVMRQCCTPFETAAEKARLCDPSCEWWQESDEKETAMVSDERRVNLTNAARLAGYSARAADQIAAKLAPEIPILTLEEAMQLLVEAEDRNMTMRRERDALRTRLAEVERERDQLDVHLFDWDMRLRAMEAGEREYQRQLAEAEPIIAAVASAQLYVMSEQHQYLIVEPDANGRAVREHARAYVAKSGSAPAVVVRSSADERRQRRVALSILRQIYTLGIDPKNAHLSARAVALLASAEQADDDMGRVWVGKLVYCPSCDDPLYETTGMTADERGYIG